MANEQEKEHFFSILRGFSRAMLTTKATDGGLHTRPMVVADVDAQGNIWLMSGKDSEKVEELAADGHANLSMQSDSQYVAISGDAHLVQDKNRIHALFKEPWKVYFPKGPDDPQIILIKIDAVYGEYWDNSGASKVKYMWEAAKAYVTGQSAKHSNDVSAKVDLGA